MGIFITFPELLIWLPVLAGIASFFLKKPGQAKNFAIFISLIILGVAVASLFFTDDTKYRSFNRVNYFWLKYIGNSFYIGFQGAGRLLTFLTALSFPLVFIATQKQGYKNPAAFYGLMLLAQAGMMGVFLSLDALLFYFFWELALIPMYFLVSIWGGEKRIQTTFKFFVYTFAGSLLMLIGIIYVYQHTAQHFFSDHTIADHSFALQAFVQAQLSTTEQSWLFWLFFVAFAIKMPVFPFHTWQPDTYDQSPYAVTMVLSGVMVKMGLFGVITWLIPVFPAAAATYAPVVITLCIVGILYSSFIAMVQDNIKMLVAYSSIAHIGLMCASFFAMTSLSVHGAMIQLFSHGVNILGMWIVADVIERRTGIRSISGLGGIAQKAPALTLFVVVIALANIALPLTNAFVGEFMMLGGLFERNMWYAIFAGLAVILGAVYTLRMIQGVFYGETNASTETFKDISLSETISLLVIVFFIFLFGVMPQPIIDFTKEAASSLLSFNR